MSDLATWHDGPLPADLFDEIYLKWTPYVFTISLRLMGHEESARDVTQDVFMRLHAHRNSIYGPGSLKA